MQLSCTIHGFFRTIPSWLKMSLKGLGNIGRHLLFEWLCNSQSGLKYFSSMKKSLTKESEQEVHNHIVTRLFNPFLHEYSCSAPPTMNIHMNKPSCRYIYRTKKLFVRFSCVDQIYHISIANRVDPDLAGCKFVIRIINRLILMGQMKTKRLSVNHINMQHIPDDSSVFTAEAKVVDLALNFIRT